MTIMAPTPTDGGRELDAVAIRRTGAGWREYLVELLVLREHGDGLAARQLGSWLAIDPVADAVSGRIIEDVRAIRTGRACIAGA